MNENSKIRWADGIGHSLIARTTVEIGGCIVQDSADIEISKFAEEFLRIWKGKTISTFLQEHGWEKLWADEIENEYYNVVAKNLYLNKNEVRRVRDAINPTGRYNERYNEWCRIWDKFSSST